MGCGASVHDLPGAGGGLPAPVGSGPKAAAPSSSPSAAGAKAATSSDLPLLTGWTCDRHGTGRHSVFGSYRVKSEGPDGNGLIEKLVDGIEAPKGAPAPAVTVFYDKRCLNTGEAWEVQLKNGLEGASLVMPLVSAAALQGMVEHAAKRQDNLLMEWEIALERQRLGECLVLPVIVDDVDGDGKPRRVDLLGASYPDAPHFFSKISIRATLVALFKINGVKVTLDRRGAPEPAQLAAAVHQVHHLLASQELRTIRHRVQQGYQDERARKEQLWKRVEAILDGNDVIGRGASSTVYRGKLDPTEVRLGQVVKDIRAQGKYLALSLPIPYTSFHVPSLSRPPSRTTPL